MRFGVTVPTVDASVLAELAAEAEAAGWDGLFTWDLPYGVDVWVSLTAAALATRTIRLGTMLTPLSRRRPWTVASQVATLDRLSGGRVILPVGLGATGEGHEHDDFRKLGEETDRKVRAARLDESLDILDGLWRGEPFSYDGTHYHIHDVTFTPQPAQRPRPPIWVVGAWPRPKSLRRALRCDGILPMKMLPGEPMTDMTPQDIRELVAYVREHRPGDAPYDIVLEDETPGDDPERAADKVRPYAEAGATWWLEAVWRTPETQGGLAGIRERIRQGPPPAVALG